MHPLIYDWNRTDRPRPAIVQLDDETLRDGFQSPSVRCPTIDEKLHILHLIDRLGPAFSPLDLDDEPYLDRSDLEAHVLDVIQSAPASPYYGQALDPLARIVARAVAERAGASFLVASRTAATIAQSGHPLSTLELDSLPTTVGEILERDLASFPDAGRKRLRSLARLRPARHWMISGLRFPASTARACGGTSRGCGAFSAPSRAPSRCPSIRSKSLPTTSWSAAARGFRQETCVARSARSLARPRSIG